MAKRITPPEAHDLLQQGWTYLDVRSVPEFEQGHPEGAVNIPLLHRGEGRMVPNADFERLVAATFPKDAKLVIGCKAGPRGMQAIALLEAAGYTNLADMRAGYAGEADMFGRVVTPGWAAAGLPCAKEAKPGCSFADIEKKA